MDQKCEVCGSEGGILIADIVDENTGEVIDHVAVCLECWAGDE